MDRGALWAGYSKLLKTLHLYVMRFHLDWCTRGKLIFNNRFIKGIRHRKFKS